MKKITNQYRRKNWWELKRKNPIRHKAYRMKMSLTTWKVKDAVKLEEIYNLLCLPQSCPFCLKTMDFEEINWDHIIPRSLGGYDLMANLQFCCMRCNQLKGALTAKDFIEFLSICKREPKLMIIFEKRIKSSLAYFSNPGKRIKYKEDVGALHNSI